MSLHGYKQAVIMTPLEFVLENEGTLRGTLEYPFCKGALFAREDWKNHYQTGEEKGPRTVGSAIRTATVTNRQHGNFPESGHNTVWAGARPYS